MQDRPDRTRLLEAVARFLTMDLRPTVQDEALRFRTLIAAHLCMVVAQELRTEDDHDDQQLERLSGLLGELVHAPGLPRRREERVELFRTLDAALAEQVREQRATTPGTPAWEHLRATLREKLSVINPRFDLSERLPGEPPAIDEA